MTEGSAPPDLISEKGWVRPEGDDRFWIPCAPSLPDEYDPATWYTMLATGWAERSGVPLTGPGVEALAAMIERAHDGYTRVPCHQIWVYLRDPAVPPLPVLIGIWKMQGERTARLRYLSGAGDTAGVRPPDVAEFATDRLGAGLRAIRYRNRNDRVVAALAYAFRAEEFETEVQVSAATPDLRQLGNALGDIDEFVRGLTVFSQEELR